MFITPSFKKSLIVEQFQGNYLKVVSMGWGVTYQSRILGMYLCTIFIISEENGTPFKIELNTKTGRILVYSEKSLVFLGLGFRTTMFILSKYFKYLKSYPST